MQNENYLSWLRDKEVIRYIGREEYLGEISFKEVKEYVHSMWQNKYISFWAVHLSESGAFIGTAKINFFNEVGTKTKTADIGIMIGERSMWGRGLATQTLSLICKYAFENLLLRKLTAGAFKENLAIVKAFKKIGFIEEGVIRKKILIGETYYDHVLLGCFRDEFIEIT